MQSSWNEAKPTEVPLIRKRFQFPQCARRIHTRNTFIHGTPYLSRNLINRLSSIDNRNISLLLEDLAEELPHASLHSFILISLGAESTTLRRFFRGDTEE